MHKTKTIESLRKIDAALKKTTDKFVGWTVLKKDLLRFKNKPVYVVFGVDFVWKFMVRAGLKPRSIEVVGWNQVVAALAAHQAVSFEHQTFDRFMHYTKTTAGLADIAASLEQQWSFPKDQEILTLEPITFMDTGAGKSLIAWLAANKAALN